MNPLSASQSTVCGLAWKRYSRQTPLRDVAPALNGRASLARVRPCRTGAASFMVARRGRAARRCDVSQPSLTTSISALERELGGALFDRKPSIVLTGLGRVVRPYLDEIARNADHAREVARTLTPRPVADRSARQAVDSSEHLSS